MLECLFFGVSDLLGEMIRVFSVGEGSRLACHVHRGHRSTREVWKARV